MRIVTFYNNKYYKNIAARLMQTGKALGYDIIPKHVSCSRWETAVSMKPGVLLAEYSKSKTEPLLYLDADIFLQRPLEELFDIVSASDISVRFRNDPNCEPYNLGVIGFGVKNYALVVKFLNAWALKMKTLAQFKQSVDQNPFCDILPAFPQLILTDITRKFNFLPADGATHNKSDAAIWHYKASRDLENETSRQWRKLFCKKEIT